MKSIIFYQAIAKRYKLKFLYNLSEFIIDPYLIAKNEKGKKVIYGRINNSNEIKEFEYDKIFNIKFISNKHFLPIIPILPMVN